MKIETHPDPSAANEAAAAYLAQRLPRPETRNFMAAGGNTPLELYRLIAQRSLPLGHIHLFALDEYVGVPVEDSRTCANFLRRTVAEPWGIPPQRFLTVSSEESAVRESIQEHERRIAARGGLDLVVLGLGQNGHLGFNEPGSAPDSVGRVVELEPISVAANRSWFGGEYAPVRGATVGLKTILSARSILILAYGPTKTKAVTAMIEGPQHTGCPASWLQSHGDVAVFLDNASAAGLRRSQTGAPSA